MILRLNHWNADYTEKLILKNVGLGQLMLYNTPESLEEKLPFYDSENELAIIADARIDNRETLFKQTALPSDSSISDSQLILEMFKIYNKRCLDHIIGAYAFTIWDENKQELFCARDHIGFKPFYYYLADNFFLFGSEPLHLFDHPKVDKTIDEQYIADGLSSLKSENHRTFHKSIRKLPPAHYLVVKPDSYEKRRYWDLDPNRKIQFNSENEYIDRFKKILDEAVKCRLRSAYPVGTELSGGIDSSAVTGFASQHVSLNTFSHTLPDWAIAKHYPYEDERQFIQKVNEYCGINQAYWVTGQKEGVIQSLKRGVQLSQGMMQNVLSLLSDVLYKEVQRTGTRTLLSGFGGDELVSYQGGGQFKELAFTHRYKKLIQEIRQANSSLNVPKQCINYIGAASLYRIKQIAGLHPEYKTPKWAYNIYNALFINPEFAENLKVKKRLFERKKLPNSPIIRTRQYLRFHYSYFPIRLEECHKLAHARKIEYRYPLLDKRLLEFYLALPTDLKINKGWGRYILRKALEDILPSDIQWRNDKVGTTIPGVNIRLNEDYRRLKELLLRAKTKNIKHYIDYDKALTMLDRMAFRFKHPNNRRIPITFYSAVMLLYYQLNEYTGEEE